MKLGLPSDPTSSSTSHFSQMPILSGYRTPHFCWPATSVPHDAMPQVHKTVWELPLRCHHPAPSLHKFLELTPPPTTLGDVLSTQGHCPPRHLQPIRGPWGAGLGSTEMINFMASATPANFGLPLVSGELSGALPREDPGTPSPPIGQNNKQWSRLPLRETTVSKAGSLHHPAPHCLHWPPASLGPPCLPRAASPLDPTLCPSWKTSCKWTTRASSSHCRRWDGKGRWGVGGKGGG